MNPVTIASMLQSYGPWGVVALESLAMFAIWRELLLERKRRDSDNQGFALAQIQNVRDAADRESRFADVLRMAFDHRRAE